MRPLCANYPKWVFECDIQCFALYRVFSILHVFLVWIQFPVSTQIYSRSIAKPHIYARLQNNIFCLIYPTRLCGRAIINMSSYTLWILLINILCIYLKLSFVFIITHTVTLLVWNFHNFKLYYEFSFVLLHVANILLAD